MTAEQERDEEVRPIERMEQAHRRSQPAHAATVLCEGTRDEYDCAEVHVRSSRGLADMDSMAAEILG